MKMFIGRKSRFRVVLTNHAAKRICKLDIKTKNKKQKKKKKKMTRHIKKRTFGQVRIRAV